MEKIAEGDICAAVGEEGFRRLVAAFYRRVPSDPLLGTMYPKSDLKAAEERLGSFLIQRFGGSDAYSQQRGHPRLRMRHAPYIINAQARDHWIVLMRAALEEVQFPDRIRAALEAYFLDTANFMINASGA